MAVTLRLKETPKAGAPARKVGTKEKEPFLTEVAPAAPAQTMGRGRKILVVDDNPVVLKAFELKLKSDGFIVCTLGEAAKVTAKVDVERPDLIILDINFPAGGAMDWNGFTIVQWLRRFAEFDSVPVIFVTGSDTAEFKLKALKAGAVAFFQKPVAYQELLGAIVKALGGGALPPAKGTQAGEVAASDEQSSPPAARAERRKR